MNKQYLSSLFCIFALSSSSGITHGGEYVREQGQNSLIYDPNPAPGEVAYWSGAKDAKGYATGFGVLTWYENGEKVSAYQGKKVRGKWKTFQEIDITQNSAPKQNQVVDSTNVVEHYIHAMESKDYLAVVGLLNSGRITPETGLPQTKVWQDVLSMLTFTDPRNPKGDIEADQFASLVGTILSQDFEKRDYFAVNAFAQATDRHRVILEAILDAGVQLTGKTYSSPIAGKLPSANSLVGFYNYKFQQYSESQMEQLGRIIGKVERSGGGTLKDFEYGVSRRGEWNQTISDVVGGAVLLAAYAGAYAGANVVGGTVSNIKNSWNSSSNSVPSSGASSSSGGGSTSSVASTPSNRSATTTRTFTVTYDERANQTGDEAGARGESSVTVGSEDGTFTVRYWYDFPSSYLISAGRGKSLEGKSVTIQFEGERATFISCGAGSGQCEVKSFSRQ